MKTMNAKTLKSMMDSKESFKLINVLDEKEFEKGHIPHSHNIPVSDPDFVNKVDAIVGDRSAKIVVYCASKDCTASPKAAKKLMDAGFTNVFDFEGGLAEWKLAGFELVEPATKSS